MAPLSFRSSRSVALPAQLRGMAQLRRRGLHAQRAAFVSAVAAPAEVRCAALCWARYGGYAVLGM